MHVGRLWSALCVGCRLQPRGRRDARCGAADQNLSHSRGGDAAAAAAALQYPAKISAARVAETAFETSGNVEAVVDIPEGEWAMIRDLAAPHRGASPLTKPQIVVTDFPDRSFDAELSVIVTTADPLTRTVAATLTFDKPDDIAIMPGMTAKVIVQTPTDLSEGVVRVPANAVVAADFPYVWLLDAKTMQVSRRNVETGTRLDAVMPVGGRDDDAGTPGAEEIEIRSGLTVGDEIAITGVKQLHKGMRIRRLGE